MYCNGGVGGYGESMKQLEHPSNCPSCGDGEVYYQVLTWEHRIYGCSNCGWEQNAVTGTIMCEGDKDKKMHK